MKLKYDLEIERVIREIKKLKAKNVLLQFPDGLKPHSKEVIKELEKKTGARIFLWLGSCYGGCDIPIHLKEKIDLVFQFGHNKFISTKNWKI